MKKVIIISLLILFGSCHGVEKTDSNKAYELWSGNEPPKGIELMNGKYYQSPHFSHEYEIFLKFKSDENWFYEFVEYNGLVIDNVGNDWTKWTEFPEWFKIDNKYLTYTKDQNNEFEHSRYFINPENGICFIYETVGM